MPGMPGAAKRSSTGRCSCRVCDGDQKVWEAIHIEIARTNRQRYVRHLRGVKEQIRIARGAR